MAILPGTRIRDNGVFGNITDNPLAAGAGSFNSPDLADLSVVSGDHALVTLDPFRQFGDSEIVMVTVHTVASSSATIQRGMFGTVARTHPQGTLWVHAAIDGDFTEVLTSSTRPADPYEGQIIYEVDTNNVLVFNGLSWVEFGGGGGSAITLAYAEVTATQAGIGTTEVDLTGLSVNITVPAGRRIRISGRVLASAWSATGVRANARIREGATQLQLDQYGPNGATNENAVLYPEVILTPSEGSHTYRLTAQSSTGAGTFSALADPTFPAYILVEDISGDPSPVDPASVPVGVIASTNIVGAAIDGTEVSLGSINISVESGRLIKLSAGAQINVSASSSLFLGRFRLGSVAGTELGRWAAESIPGSESIVSDNSIILSLPAGSHTIHATGQRASGAGVFSVINVATVPGWLFAEDITPTPAPSSGAPGSTLGYSETLTDPAVTFTAETDLAGLSTVVTVPAGRRLKITGAIHLESTVANDRAQLLIKESTTTLDAGTLVCDVANVAGHIQQSVIVTPSEGSHTYRLAALRSGGTGNISARASATQPAFILVEDITGSVWPEGEEVTVGMIASDPWIDYVPTLSGSTLGTGGIITGRYQKIGRTVSFHIFLQFGSGLSVGNTFLGLPVEASGFQVQLGSDALGVAVLHDSGTANYTATARGGATTAVGIVVNGTNGVHTALAPTTPFTWASGDRITVNGTYEAAS